MKRLALLGLIVLQCSCTTLVNRRDLYSPEPAPNSRETIKRMAGTTTTTTPTKIQTEEKPAPPEFRY